MFPLIVRYRFFRSWRPVGVAVATLTLLGAPPAVRAEDFNADYPTSGVATNSCTFACGGVGVSVQGMFTPSSYYISINSVRYMTFTPAAKYCSPTDVTLVSLATNNVSGNPCIQANDVFHVGFSTGASSHTVLSAILY